MIDPIISPIVLTACYEFVKFWLPIGGFFLGIYKGWDWVKRSITGITEDIRDIKTSLNSQTVALTAEMKEQRNDFRAFFLPLFTAAQAQTLAARPARAKRTIKTVNKKSVKNGLTRK
jgi:hypothetical protein